MNETDKRDALDEEIFSYRATKDGKILVYWQSKQVMLLKGKEAQKLQVKLAGADARQTQLLLAKLTGNFKRGNERTAQEHTDKDQASSGNML